jgi:hypothetical protein
MRTPTYAAAAADGLTVPTLAWAFGPPLARSIRVPVSDQLGLEVDAIAGRAHTFDGDRNEALSERPDPAVASDPSIYLG